MTDDQISVPLCAYHNDRPAEGYCNQCGQPVCAECYLAHGDRRLCPVLYRQRGEAPGQHAGPGLWHHRRRAAAVPDRGRGRVHGLFAPRRGPASGGFAGGREYPAGRGLRPHRPGPGAHAARHGVPQPDPHQPARHRLPDLPGADARSDARASAERGLSRVPGHDPGAALATALGTAPRAGDAGLGGGPARGDAGPCRLGWARSPATRRTGRRPR